MDDVKPQTDVAPQATEVEAETTSQPEAPAEKKTAEVAGGSQASAPPPVRTVPYQALDKERTLRKEAQRKLAELQAQAQPQYQNPAEQQGDDWEKVITHPFVQNLMMQQAKRELTDYARELLDQYPQIPDPVKKAILKNPRGYVQETTTDVENAKLDLAEYVETLVESEVAPAAPAKAFPVAATNATGTQTAARPADVARILAKPVEDWTKEEEQIVAEYQQSAKK